MCLWIYRQACCDKTLYYKYLRNVETGFDQFLLYQSSPKRVYSVNQNKVHPNVLLFYKILKVIQKHGSLASRGILNLSIRFRQSISTSILLKCPNFAFVQGSADLVIKVQISKLWKRWNLIVFALVISNYILICLCHKWKLTL